MTAGRKLALACAAVVAVVGPAAAGAVGGAASSAGTFAQLLPAFDAISIRQNRSGDSAGGGRITPDGGLLFRNSSIQELIVDAYSTQDGRVRGGPGWVSADKYDIDARTAGPVAIEETRLMLQSLLVDRFKLRTHWQTEELSGYALVVARGGPRLTLNADPKCGGACGVTQSITGELTARKLPLSELAPRLERILGRPVVDRTGVSGDFDFTLRWAPDTTQFGGRGQELSNDQRPSLIAALEEQVGLKLEATKVPVQFLVIDAIERPSEN